MRTRTRRPASTGPSTRPAHDGPFEGRLHDPRGLRREQGRRGARAPRQRPARHRATAVEGARSGSRSRVSGCSSGGRSTGGRPSSSPIAGRAATTVGRGQRRGVGRGRCCRAVDADPQQRRPGRAERARALARDRPPSRTRARRDSAGRRRRPESRHPAWDKRPPFVLDLDAAAALGYVPDGDYATTVAHELDWLVAAARGDGEPWAIPPADDAYFAPLLDYTAETPISQPSRARRRGRSSAAARARRGAG